MLIQLISKEGVYLNFGILFPRSIITKTYYSSVNRQFYLFDKYFDFFLSLHYDTIASW